MILKGSIDNILKLCANCQHRCFNLNGSGSLFRPLVYDKLVKKGDTYKPQLNQLSPTKYFIFGEKEYEDAKACLYENGMKSKYTTLCDCSNFIFTNNKSISIHRKNAFYKALSRTIQKGHIKMQIENTCPYFMEIWFMKTNAKQNFKNIVLKDF